MRTLLDYLHFYAKQKPDKIFAIDADRNTSITYLQLWNTVEAFAARIKTLGLKKGDRIVVRVDSIIETLIAQFAVYLAGGVYCPVEKNMKDSRIKEMLSHLESNFLISTELPPHNDIKYINLLSAKSYGQSEYNFDFPNPEDICAIIFTTGTTGKSKGVMLSHGSSISHAHMQKEVLGICEQDVFLWKSPLDKIPGIRAFTGALIIGASVVHYIETMSAKKYFNVLELFNVSIINLSPYELKILLDLNENSFANFKNQIKSILFAGSSLTQSQRKYIKELLPNSGLFSFYGATEISAISSYNFGLYSIKENCVGTPAGDTEISILDQNENVILDCSIDNPGVVACKNGAMMMGYWKDPDLTNSVIRNGFIIMTDIGYIDDEGLLYIMGRKDDVIVTGGYKVAPYEIENVVMQISGISECACVPSPHHLLGNIIKLFVVMKEGYEFSARDISVFLSNRLENYKQPRIIRQLDSMPRTEANNKIDRKALIDRE